MNCKPNDLAVIVRSSGSGIQRRLGDLLIGRIVTVTHLRRPKHWSCSAIEVWNFANEIEIEFNGEVFGVTGCEDANVRPLRHPGDDDRDETLSWLPVPMKEIA